MNDSKIVKALRDILKLMLNEGDLQRASSIKRAIDLINHLKEENEALQNLLVKTNATIAKQETEIERYKLNMPYFEHQSGDFCGVVCNFAEELIAKGKVEAVKEFAARLEPLKKFRSCMATSEYELCVTMREVDAIKKEMIKELGCGGNEKR